MSFTALKKITLTALIITGPLVVGVNSAQAELIVKPNITAYSKYYYKQEKAVDSANKRWIAKAAEAYGASFAHRKNAVQRGTKCQKQPNNTIRCKVWGKPAKNVAICNAKLSAQGMFYANKAEAKQSSQYRWGLKAADKYGASFALWGKAKSKSHACKKQPNTLWRCSAIAKPCK